MPRKGTCVLPQTPEGTARGHTEGRVQVLRQCIEVSPCCEEWEAEWGSEALGLDSISACSRVCPAMVKFIWMRRVEWKPLEPSLLAVARQRLPCSWVHVRFHSSSAILLGGRNQLFLQGQVLALRPMGWLLFKSQTSP